MAQGSTIKALLVEDNPGDVRLVQELLKDAGAPVNLETTSNLDDGVHRVLDGEYDVVLLDLNLPDSAGLESVFTVNLFDNAIPIVVLTSLDDPEASFQAIQQGAQDYLVKGSFDGNQLLRTMRFAIDRCRVQQRLQEGRADEEVQVPERPETDEAPEEGNARVDASGDRDGRVQLAHKLDGKMRALVCPTGGELVRTLAAYLNHLLAAGKRVVYVALDRPSTVLKESFAEAGVKLDHVQFLDAAANDLRRTGGDDEAHSPYGHAPVDLQKVGMRIETICGELGPRAHVILDSLNALLVYNPVDEVAEFAHYLANRLRLLGLSGDYVSHNNQEWAILADRFASFLDGEVVVGQGEKGKEPSFDLSLI